MQGYSWTHKYVLTNEIIYLSFKFWFIILLEEIQQVIFGIVNIHHFIKFIFYVFSLACLKFDAFLISMTFSLLNNERKHRVIVVILFNPTTLMSQEDFSMQEKAEKIYKLLPIYVYKLKIRRKKIKRSCQSTSKL